MASVQDLGKCRVLLTLFFAWNVSQTFEELEAKQSIMIHRIKVTHPLFISITGVCTSTIVHFVFSVIAGLIVKMPFTLFSVYKTAYNGLKMNEYKAYWLKDFQIIII